MLGCDCTQVRVMKVRGDTCVFPFIYKGTTYSSCKAADDGTRWCATAVDSDGVYEGAWRECATSLPEMSFLAPGAANVHSATPCADAGLLATYQSECEAAAPIVAPPGVLGMAPVNTVGDWGSLPVGCSLEAGYVSASVGGGATFDGDFALHWNTRVPVVRSKGWSPAHRPLCRVPSKGPGAARTGFYFRNPPHFVPNTGEATDMPGDDEAAAPYTSGGHLVAAGERETEALLDHLFEHTNTPPFVATRMIQRLVASNPSPRYTKVVATAFAEGAYGGVVYSGRYGCMAAMLAATLLDREARCSILDYDPAHGSLREPLIKVIQVLRSMEFQPKRGMEIELGAMRNKIGQMVFESPSVFSFYLPEFSPAGPVAKSRLVAPEAQLAIAPYIIGYLNGMASLINNGLNYCDHGFGGWRGNWHGCADDSAAAAASEGKLEFKPTDPANPAKAVDELLLLLTGGRTSNEARAALIET